jgi:hypothetical protein
MCTYNTELLRGSGSIYSNLIVKTSFIEIPTVADKTEVDAELNQYTFVILHVLLLLLLFL